MKAVFEKLIFAGIILYVPGRVHSLCFVKSCAMVWTIHRQKIIKIMDRERTYLICCLYTGDSKLLIQQFFLNY